MHMIHLCYGSPFYTEADWDLRSRLLRCWCVEVSLIYSGVQPHELQYDSLSVYTESP